jgi:N-acetylmuramoyl-L-alanine amidase
MKFSELLQNKLNQEINTEKAKKSKPNDSYYILINSKCPGVIIECGFLSNKEEEEKLTQSEYQRQLSEIICDCIKEYLGC